MKLQKDQKIPNIKQLKIKKETKMVEKYQKKYISQEKDGKLLLIKC